MPFFGESNRLVNYAGMTKIHMFFSVQSIRSEMKSKPNGFDPEHIFMNGSLNVTSAFCLNELNDFGDPEQVKVRRLLIIF